MKEAWEILRVDAVDCDLVEAPWSFAELHAADIDRHWEFRLRRTPELFNGKVLMLSFGKIERAARRTVFRGALSAVDFKAFLAWRELGPPPGEWRNCFSMAALETADGAFVLGEMAPYTASAGSIYFPSGTPDLHDVVGGKVDIDGSARRELREETGLTEPNVTFDPALTLVMNQHRVCCMKRVHSTATADALVEQIHAWFARESKPEFVRMHIVRCPDDLTARVPSFVAAYIRARLQG